MLVTSALPYANGPLHLGHIAGAYLPADVYVRYQRLKGRDVLFICGSDEHGVPITVTADREGITPQDVVDRYHVLNKKSFEDLGIRFDNYSRTSLPVHHQTAQEFFSKLHGQNDLVIKTEKQFYSEKSKRFLPDRYVEGVCPVCRYEKARGDQCDKCGKWMEPRELIHPVSKVDGSRPVLKDTRHWYFPMGRFADTWKNWFDSGNWKENVRNYSLGWYNEGLGDRPITRDLAWGVPVPLPDAQGKVLYVWFDAPIGYISSTKEWAEKEGKPEKWKDYWCDPDTRLIHFIGKDNIVFHAILFPMMLQRMGGYVLPSAIPAHEYLTIEGRKISTSLNYAVWVKDYLEVFPPDPLRYTLAANAPENKDTDFSWKQFQNRNNDELADILGNFIHRTLTFVERYSGGKVPARGRLSVLDKNILRAAADAPENMGSLLEKFEFRQATKVFMDLCRAANKYFNDSAPWEKRKSDPEACGTTLNVCLQVAKTVSVIMSPILPASSEKLRAMLNLGEHADWDSAGKPDLAEGHALGKPDILFTKIEDDVIEQEIRKLQALDSGNAVQGPEAGAGRIDIAFFQKVEMKTARVLEAQSVPGSDRLLKLQIDLGSEKRQIVAGVAQSYTPESLVGKTIIVVANLKTAQIRGVTSDGMLLAVQTGAGHRLLITDGDVEPGRRIS
ncbi:methionine--tRNA ligase [bacterium]|nr:methionine--tRNA ligase [bacterium]